ncbi:MAG: trehalose-phosphatase [Chloroflexi bacterium]|nr:trehalose-phosphatase [Chloroflexota bacterium]
MYESASGGDNADSGGAHLVGRVLAVLGAGAAGLVTDVDGTISPIVARPEEAMVLPRARAALIGLSQYLNVVGVVTGRSVADARQMVGVDGLTYIGNHGLEMLRDGRAETLPEARPWVPRLAAALGQVATHLPTDLREGVIVENKGATASLHYRLAPDPDQTRRVLLELLTRWAVSAGFRVEEGRRVFNLLPPLAVTKGTAVTWLVRERHLEGIVFFGDDLTDAHAFRALSELRQAGQARTLSIAVVGPETPHTVRQLADACVPTASAVAELLRGVLDGLKSSVRMESRAPNVLE